MFPLSISGAIPAPSPALALALLTTLTVGERVLAAPHSRARINDPRSHGVVDDQFLSLAEAIMLPLDNPATGPNGLRFYADPRASVLLTTPSRPSACWSGSNSSSTSRSPPIPELPPLLSGYFRDNARSFASSQLALSLPCKRLCSHAKPLTPRTVACGPSSRRDTRRSELQHDLDRAGA